MSEEKGQAEEIRRAFEQEFGRFVFGFNNFS